ncbi:MAG TPA: glycosyltransferase [Chloroflexota bacterium]|jgi:GT2 family glycosyltransferase
MDVEDAGRGGRRAPVAVLLKTWNTPECTQLCLAALGEAELLPTELVVVDLGEDEATRSYAARLAERTGITLTWRPIGRRIAPGEANRLALAEASSPLICLLDSDVLVPRSWLAPPLALLADPEVGLVAPIRPDPFLVHPDAGATASTEAALDAVKSTGAPFGEVADRYTGGRSLEAFGRAVAEANGLDRVAAVGFPSFLSSCCLLFDRSTVDEAGGVADPLFDGGYGSEDVDLSWRVMRAGYRLVRTSEVFVLHFRHASLDANRIDREAELRTANRLLYRRWRKRLLAWAAERRRAGDSLEDLARRFLVRELVRNTSFGADLEAAPA